MFGVETIPYTWTPKFVRKDATVSTRARERSFPILNSVCDDSMNLEEEIEVSRECEDVTCRIAKLYERILEMTKALYYDVTSVYTLRSGGHGVWSGRKIAREHALTSVYYRTVHICLKSSDCDR